MFNLPYIAYGIFVLMLAINIFIGYKRGWKTALYVFGLIFVASGISIGISYGLYPVLRDPVGKMLKKVFNGDNQYDYTFLSDATKAHVLAFLISVLLVPITLLLWLITFTIWHFVQKMDAPLLTRRNSFNEKEVVFANSTKSKIISLSITTVSSILSASLITSAITPIVTKSKNYNFFNAFTGGISRGLTFNQGYTDASTQMTYDIIPMTHDRNLMSGLQFVLKPEAWSNFTQTDIKNFNQSENLSRLTEILNGAKTYGILSFISSGIGGDENYWRPLGNDETNPSVDKYSIDKMKAFFESMNMTLNSTAAESLASWIKDEAIMPWEKTDAYLNNKNAQDTLDAMKKRIDNTKSEVAKLTTEAQEQKSKIQSAIAQLSALYQKMVGSANINADLFSGMEGWKALPAVITDNQKIVAAKTIDRDNAQTALNTATNNLNDYDTNTYTPAQNTYQNAQTATASAKSSQEYAKAQLDANQMKIDLGKQAVQKVADLTKQINTLTTEINTLNTSLSSSQNTLNQKDQARQSAQNDLKSAQANYDQAKADLDKADQEVQQKTAERDRRQAELNSANNNKLPDRQTIYQAETLLQNAKNDLITAIINHTKAVQEESAKKQTLNSKQNAYTNAQRDYDAARQSTDAISNDISSKTSNKSSLEAQKRNAENEVSDGQAAESQKSNLENAYKSATTDYSQKQGQERSAKSTFDIAQAEHSRLENVQSAKQAELNSKEAALSSAQEKLQKYVNRKDAIKQELEDQTEINQIHQNRKDAETRYQEIMRQDPFNASNTTKIAENYEYNEEDWGADFIQSKIVDRNANNLAQRINNIDFKNSLEYLTNTNSSAKPVAIKVQNIKNSNESFSSKDITDIKSGTEGTLQILEYNFAEYQKCKDALEIYMESQHKVFNNNIDEYLKMVKEVFST